MFVQFAPVRTVLIFFLAGCGSQAEGGGVDASTPSASDGQPATSETASEIGAEVLQDTRKETAPPPIDSSARLGTSLNPAKSCMDILKRASPFTPDGYYIVRPEGTDEVFRAFCDMTQAGGGWTEVTPKWSDDAASALVGKSGRQMLKCRTNTRPHIVSPKFAAPWSWTRSRKVSGTWTVTDMSQTCGDDSEFEKVASACSTSSWGVGCSSGAGDVNKLYPGSAGSSPPKCADKSSALTGGAFTVCGANDFSTYALFLREE